MKITTTALLSLLLIISKFGTSQNYTSEISSIFSTKDDVDFSLVSEANGTSSPCKYYVANDTFYEVSSRKIALKDIDFSKIHMYKNVFNFINGVYPYELTLRPKANCFTFYYGTRVNGVIDLYFPNEAYAIQAFAWLKAKADEVGTTAKQNSYSDDAAKQICMNMQYFLNDLITSNLNSYIDDVKYWEEGFITYWSKTHFPFSIFTHIVDTNMFNPVYRSAEIVFMEEYPSERILSHELWTKYNDLADVVYDCLTNNGFTYTNKDTDPDVLYVLQCDFTKYKEPDPNALFSALQEKKGFRVVVCVTQSSNGDGTFTNSLKMLLTAQ